MNDSVAAPQPHSTWRRAKLVLKIIEIRLRFVAILLATALFVGYWDTLKNYWDRWTRPAVSGVTQLAPGKELYCPMHPKVIRDDLEPDGSMPKCPICGMPLSERTKGETEELPEGVTARVQISPERVQMAGIETVEVGYRPLGRELTAVGSVAFDESRLSRVVSRVSGYVEKLFIDKTYENVRRDQPLAEIYSPDLFSTAQELLIARRSGVASDLAQSARRRLTLFGVGDAEIDAIVASGKATPRLTIRSPQAGVVTRKNVTVGTRVEDGMMLLEVADLSSVWIEADIYEKDIPLLAAGQAITAVVEALPNRTFSGKVALVYPQLDAATRTNRVRFQVANADGHLRPGMFATVKIEAPRKQAEVLAVPERAVIDTGAKQVVYIESKPGVFDGVLVELGPRSGDYYPVLKGLEEGDRVAAAGAFLIDAETRLNPAAAGTFYGATGAPQAGRSTSPATGRRAKPPRPTGEALENIAKLPATDRQLALEQGTCPITEAALGSMGPPKKILVQGQPVFVCCPACEKEAVTNAAKTLEKVAKFKAAVRSGKTSAAATTNGEKTTSQEQTTSEGKTP